MKLKNLLYKDKKKEEISKKIELIRSSDLFDENWYYHTYPDVLAVHRDAAHHYFIDGWLEGRNPSDKFNTLEYLSQYPELLEKGICPLLHYIIAQQEIETNEKIKSMSNYDLIAQSPYWDEKYYLKHHPNVQKRGADAIKHYLNYGGREGYNPSAQFDGQAYYKMYTSVKIAKMNPLVHYEKYGRKAKLKVCAVNTKSREISDKIKKVFDKYADKSENYQLIAKSKYFKKRWYLHEYPEVAKASVDPIEHYLTIGWKEGKNPSSDFDGEKYLNTYGSVRTANLNPLLHYERYGKKQKLRIFQVIKSVFPEGTEDIIWNNTTEKKKIKKIAVFASFSADGKIADYVLYYLKGLKKVCDAIIFVTDNPLFPKEIDKIKNLVVSAEVARHGEYDFGSYKRGYLYALNNHLLDNAEELIFCNDSCYGPVYPFKKMFKTMSKRKIDFWGVCANDEFQYHLQSYFLVFKKKVFTSTAFSDFILSIKKEANVSQVVLRYETRFTNVLQEAGFICDSFVPFAPNDEVYPYMYTHNMTFFPLYLMENECPFLKVKALTKRGCNYEGVFKTLAYVKSINTELYKYLPQATELEKQPSFSIIMPTYNRKDIIDKPIQSVLKQTYQNFELIIVDDGSKDGTDKYIKKKYAKEIGSGKIKYFYKNNEGVCKARNYGLKQAQNEWIAYLDSDNLFYPHFLEIFVTAISQYKNKVFYAKLRRMSDSKLVGHDFDYQSLLKGNYIDLGTFIHHRSVYEKVGGFDEHMTRLVDWDLIVCYTKKYKPVHLPWPVLLYNDLDTHIRISNSVSYENNLKYFRKKHNQINLPKITTMITTYNHEDYIREAIESAIKQGGFFEHEILISDDASTDNTPEIIAEYAAKYPYLIRDISSKENLGISANMKKCFEAATGKYIAILEGDDYWTDSKKLEKQMQFLEKHKDCSMVFSKLQVLNQTTQKISFLERQKNLPTKLSGQNVINEPTLNLIGNFSCCMFRTEIMKSLPDVLYTSRLNEISLSFYLEQKGYLGFISTPLSVYRQHLASVWTGADKKKQLEQGLRNRQVAFTVCKDKYKSKLKKIIEQKYMLPLSFIRKQEAIRETIYALNNFYVGL